MRTLPDYLRRDLEIVSIGLNPSLRSAATGVYFANPRNRFWSAVEGAGLAPGPLAPGTAAVRALFEQHGIGFTDVVKRATAGAGGLRAADFRRGAPLLKEKLECFAPRIAWFHGKIAYRSYLRYADGVAPSVDWGAQQRPIGSSVVFVTPNPSPANAAYSLAVLTGWYAALQELRVRLARCGARPPPS